MRRIVLICFLVLAACHSSSHPDVTKQPVPHAKTGFMTGFLPGPGLDTLTRLKDTASPSSAIVAIPGDGDQLELQDSRFPGHALHIRNNGSSIWDVETDSATGSDDQVIRFFRHTVTTGEYRIDVAAGTSAAEIQLRPHATSDLGAHHGVRFAAKLFESGKPTVSVGSIESDSTNFAGRISGITGSSVTMTWSIDDIPYNGGGGCMTEPASFSIITADSGNYATSVTFTCYDGSGALMTCPTFAYWCWGDQ